jgi:hypothetical protein
MPESFVIPWDNDSECYFDENLLQNVEFGGNNFFMPEQQVSFQELNGFISQNNNQYTTSITENIIFPTENVHFLDGNYSNNSDYISNNNNNNQVESSHKNINNTSNTNGFNNSTDKIDDLLIDFDKIIQERQRIMKEEQKLKTEDELLKPLERAAFEFVIKRNPEIDLKKIRKLKKEKQTLSKSEKELKIKIGQLETALLKRNEDVIFYEEFQKIVSNIYPESYTKEAFKEEGNGRKKIENFLKLGHASQRNLVKQIETQKKELKEAVQKISSLNEEFGKKESDSNTTINFLKEEIFLFQEEKVKREEENDFLKKRNEQLTQETEETMENFLQTLETSKKLLMNKKSKIEKFL